MTTPEQRQDVAQARAHADLARLRFSTALGNVRQRISPGRLKDDALTAVGEKVESAKLQARMSIRSHPVLMASAASGFVALLFWRPARTTLLYGARLAQIVWLNRKLWSASSDD